MSGYYYYYIILWFQSATPMLLEVYAYEHLLNLLRFNLH